METKKENDSAESPQTMDYKREFLYLGHYIKYNLYLAIKVFLFCRLMRECGDTDRALEKTKYVLNELDDEVSKK